LNFRDLKLPDEIYTTDKNPIETFFIPILKLSKEYDVAVGYFSSRWFRDAAAGIASLIYNKGKSRWIINPELSEDDWKIFDDLSDQDKEEWIGQKIDITIDDLMESLENDTRNTIAWLVHENILEFKIAIPTRKLSGIFHPKIGVFTDFDGNKIAFTGSYNHTGRAALNWDHIEIFANWEISSRVESKEIKFNSLWNKQDPNINVYLPTEKSIRKIISYKGTKPKVEFSEQPKNKPTIPEYYLKDGKLRKHQENAIEAWFKNNGRGIYHMATGSGKTVTALATATRLLAMKRPDVFVCLDSKNRSALCKDFGVVQSKLDYDRYWNEIVERIFDSDWWINPKPKDDIEKDVSNSRAAFLDSIYYEE